MQWQQAARWERTVGSRPSGAVPASVRRRMPRNRATATRGARCRLLGIGVVAVATPKNARRHAGYPRHGSEVREPCAGSRHVTARRGCVFTTTPSVGKLPARSVQPAFAPRRVGSARHAYRHVTARHRQASWNATATCCFARLRLTHFRRPTDG